VTLTRKLFTFAIAAGLTVIGTPVRARTGETPRTIAITASKFHFTPDRITLKKGQPVRILLTSSDRVHGFMIRALGIDTDVVPGKTGEFMVTPKTAGTFKAICDHYCGLGHGFMKMTVVVE